MKGKTFTALCMAAALAVASPAIVQASDEQSKETIVVGAAYIPENTDPLVSCWTLTSMGISESVYEQDPEGNLVSRIISSVNHDSDLEWTLELNDGIKFSDGSDLDAQAFCDAMNYIQENNALSNATAGKVTFTAEDEDTVKAVTEREITAMDSLLCEYTNIPFKNSGDEQIFTGPYKIDEIDPGVSLTLSPNEYYDDRASERPEIIMKVFNDTAAMQQGFESGEVDLMTTIPQDVATNLENEGYNVKYYDAGNQYFLYVNIARSPMDDSLVRQAVNKAINREDMVTALGGGQVATGFFAHYYPFAGECEEVYDPDAAGKLLDEAGWVMGEDGIREKDGQKLSITIKSYPSRPDLTIMMQLTASNLKDVGFDVTTEMIENNKEEAQAGTYDLLFFCEHTAPSAEPSNSLSQYFRTGQARNYNGYSNEEVDSLLDTMGETEDLAEKNELAKQIQDIIFEDLPVLYMIDPQWRVAVSDRLANYEPYCGEYYIINSEIGLE